MEAERVAKEQAEAQKHAEAVASLPALLQEISEPEEAVFELIDEVRTNRDLAIQLKNALGRGPNSIKVIIGGKVETITGKKLDYVPSEFLKQSEAINA